MKKNKSVLVNGSSNKNPSLQNELQQKFIRTLLRTKWPEINEQVKKLSGPA